MRAANVESWMTYRMALKGKDASINAVCEAGEWAALQAARPGLLTLVQSGIDNEGAAERLARGTAGNPAPRKGSGPLSAPAAEG